MTFVVESSSSRFRLLISAHLGEDWIMELSFFFFFFVYLLLHSANSTKMHWKIEFEFVPLCLQRLRQKIENKGKRLIENVLKRQDVYRQNVLGYQIRRNTHRHPTTTTLISKKKNLKEIRLWGVLWGLFFFFSIQNESSER